MDLIQEKTDELIEFIRQGEIYSKYNEAAQVLDGHEDLKGWINQFRTHTYRMYNEDTEVDLFEETDRVEQEYQELRKIPEVNAYLEAELELCRLLRTVETKINKELDFSIPEL